VQDTSVGTESLGGIVRQSCRDESHCRITGQNCKAELLDIVARQIHGVGSVGQKCRSNRSRIGG